MAGPNESRERLPPHQLDAKKSRPSQTHHVTGVELDLDSIKDVNLFFAQSLRGVFRDIVVPAVAGLPDSLIASRDLLSYGCRRGQVR
jgi:hypothetical protein